MIDNSLLYDSLKSTDSDIYTYIQSELYREKTQLQLIASENMVSRSVMEAQGSILTNKYAEGYPNKRYYSGCKWVDKIEELAIERLCKLFKCKFANVQPHSGSQANQEVFMSLLEPGDKILGMSLDCGGHLTHGAAPNFSGKWFKSIQYGVNSSNFLVDMDEIEELAIIHKPKVIIAGSSSYPRMLDFKRFRQISDKVGAYLMADIAHYAGLVATGLYPSPFEHAHVVTSTTHKTLRGPRGGIIMTNDEDVYKKIQSSVFPGLQGGPLMHVIAAKAVSFAEALKPEFKIYAKQVVENAQILAKDLLKYDFDVITGGTDTHMVLIDLRSKGLTGKGAELSLEKAGIVCNKNTVPFDNKKPFITSGLRLGTPFETSRGLKAMEFQQVAYYIKEVLDGLIVNKDNNSVIENSIKQEVSAICRSFSI